MSIYTDWFYTFLGLVAGFLLKVLYDELKSPKIKIISVSNQPFSITKDYSNYYGAYRIRIENEQKKLLNCAAENCKAWIDLESAPENYQICWVGEQSEVTINAGDIQEVDFCARRNKTGEICAPTEQGYFKPSPRIIGDGKSDLKGKLRITSKNGKREERSFIIKPCNNRLEIGILDLPTTKN